MSDQQVEIISSCNDDGRCDIFIKSPLERKRDAKGHKALMYMTFKPTLFLEN
jgi:hypothetical protein